MNGNAARGMVLAALGVLIGIFVLNSGFDSTSTGAATPAGSDTGSAAEDPEPDPEPDPGADGGTTDGTADTADDSTVPEATDGTAATTDGTGVDFSDGEFTQHPPQDVRVLVGNGTEIGGAAGRAKDTLVANAYNALPPQNATLVTSSTAFYYIEGYEGDARQIARLVGGTPDQVQPMPATPPVLDLSDAHVFVHLGTDLATT